jgi:hypothetical protein
MLTGRDKKILKFMEEIGVGLTINQAAMMYFPKKFSYYYARTRLHTLWHDMKVIQRYTNSYTDELIYYFDKKPTFHNNAILNVYANFISSGYTVTEFKRECEWLGGKYRSDAFIKAETEEETRIVIVEVDFNCVTNIKKYEELYETQELQRKYGDFPMILILTDAERKYKSDLFEVVTLDIRCSNFSKVLI